MGAKDRATNRVVAEPVAQTDKATLQGFVEDYAAPDAAVYTEQMTAVARGIVGKRLPYRDLVAGGPAYP